MSRRSAATGYLAPSRMTKSNSLTIGAAESTGPYRAVETSCLPCCTPYRHLEWFDDIFFESSVGSLPYTLF